jgi:hypothetical protein
MTFADTALCCAAMSSNAWAADEEEEEEEAEEAGAEAEADSDAEDIFDGFFSS